MSNIKPLIFIKYKMLILKKESRKSIMINKNEFT